jgi:hypothetical protein
MTNIIELLKICDDINKIENNPYFQNLRNNFEYLPIFIQQQKSFSLAVDHWSKILGKLIYKVPTYKERFVIIRNLYDEHGNGDLNNSHVCTIKRFICSLENITTKHSLLNYDSNVQKILNNSLDEILETKSWIFVVSVLGIVEYTFITVSKLINEYVSNFIEQNKIEHYSLHEILDIEHATELLSLVLPYINDDEKNNDIYEGIKFGYDIMDNLYLSFLSNNDF